ncbi:ATP synthase subunit I [Halomonas urumqiensis]|nr:ATP synthase subunit I [Halomonas urumqiensis]
MRKLSAAIKRQSIAVHLWWLQCLAVLVVTVVAAVAAGVSGTLSSLTGGMVCLLPQLFYICRLGRSWRRKPHAVVMDFYRAETGKFGSTVALFVIMFVTVPPSNPIFFFSAYTAAQLMYWLIPWLQHDRPAP